jgi:ketosteroid isomerase-like protein
MTTATATITQAFERYVDTFQSLDPKATLRHLQVPTLVLDARGAVVLSTEADAEAFLTKVMRDLAARGYTRSEITESYVHLLDETTALVSVNRVRYATAGRELERVGETYTLRKTADDWKIVVAVVHDASGVLTDSWYRPAGATSG